MINQTFISTFFLLDFSRILGLQIIHIIVFLVFYLTTMTGNLLIIIAVISDHHLHKPMYFFIFNLAVMDLCSVSVIVPKSMVCSLTKDNSISYAGCVAQIFFLFFFQSSGFCLLTAMSYDRYVAICDPLNYERIMHKGTCIWIALIAWMVGLLNASLQTTGIFTISYCSNIIHQFFCEVPALLKLSCSDMNVAEFGMIAFGCSLGIGCFIYIITTYMHIFSAVSKIPSVHGQKKALSTCFPHLAVVSLFLSTGMFAYIKPPTNESSDLDVAFAAIYTIIPPMLNPFIYSMRNREMKAALWNLLDPGHFSKCFLQLLL